MALADLQRHLAASLAGQGPGPEGMDREVLERARRSLESKRRRAASHLLPRLHEALGITWKDRFAGHAARYTPCGLLYHVDDAWELALSLARDSDRRVAIAAREDLSELRLRWVRGRESEAGRIRERRGLMVAWVNGIVVLKLPGVGGRVWRIAISSA